MDKRLAKYNTRVRAFYPLLKEECVRRILKFEIYRAILKPILLCKAEHGR